MNKKNYCIFTDKRAYTYDKNMQKKKQTFLLKKKNA